MNEHFDKVFQEFDKIFQEDWPFNSGFSGFSGFAGYSGLRGYSGTAYGGHSYIQKVSDHIDKISKHIDDIGTTIDDFDSGPTYEKIPFVIPKLVYYILGIIVAAGTTIMLLSILDRCLKG